MSRTIINGNGWYLFGIADNQKIQKVVSSTNPTNTLSDYIVANHSADVEYAYVVQKHNPVRAWIVHNTDGDYEVHTNSLLGSGETFSIQWKNGESIRQNDTSEDVTAFDVSNFDSTDPTLIESASLNNNNGDGGDYDTEKSNNLSVVVTKKNSNDEILEVLTASLEPLVVYGTTKGTSGGTDDEKYWTGEVNGELFAHSNTDPAAEGGGEFRWYRKSYGGVESKITGANTYNYTIQGDDASKEIIVKYGIFPVDSDDPTSNSEAADNAIAGVATYQSIGAASDPFANNNWQRVFFPSGPQSWKNTTKSTLGVWVKIINFYDTVAPVIDTDETVEFVSPDTWDVTASDNTAQHIDIPFSKELRLPHVALNNFSIIVKDNRSENGTDVDGTNDISDQISKYHMTSTTHPNKRHIFSPSAVTVGDGTTFSNKILRLTLPHRTAGSNYYPYVFEGDVVKVSFTRTGGDPVDGGTGTILKDTSAYDGTTAIPERNAPAGSDYYGGYDKQTLGYGNLVENFSEVSVNNSSGNKSTFDNRSPTIATGGVDVSGNGIDIIINFNEDLDSDKTTNAAIGSTSNFKVSYTDPRTHIQRNGGQMSTWGKDANGGSSTNADLSYTDQNPTSVVKSGDRQIKLTMANTGANMHKIYKWYSYAKHSYTVEYVNPTTTANGLTDDSRFKNKVNSFTIGNNDTDTGAHQNGSTTDNTYPYLTKGTLTHPKTQNKAGTNIITITADNGESGNTYSWSITEYTDADAGTAVTDGDKRFKLSADTGSSIKIQVKNDPTFIFSTYVYYDSTTSVSKGDMIGPYTVGDDSKTYYVLNDAGPREPFELSTVASGGNLVVGETLKSFVTAVGGTLRINKYYDVLDLSTSGTPAFVTATDTSILYEKRTQGITSKSYYVKVTVTDNTGLITKSPLITITPTGVTVKSSNYILSESLIAANVEVVKNSNFVAIYSIVRPQDHNGSNISTYSWHKGMFTFGPYYGITSTEKKWETLMMEYSAGYYGYSQATWDGLQQMTVSNYVGAGTGASSIMSVSQQGAAVQMLAGDAGSGFGPTGLPSEKIGSSTSDSFLRIKDTWKFLERTSDTDSNLKNKNNDDFVYFGGFSKVGVNNRTADFVLENNGATVPNTQQARFVYYTGSSVQSGDSQTPYVKDAQTIGSVVQPRNNYYINNNPVQANTNNNTTTPIKDKKIFVVNAGRDIRESSGSKHPKRPEDL